jgi:hypothetical protein
MLELHGGELKRDVLSWKSLKYIKVTRSLLGMVRFYQRFTRGIIRLDTKVSSITHHGKIEDVLYVRRVEVYASGQLRNHELYYLIYDLDSSIMEHGDVIYLTKRVTSRWNIRN